MEFVLQDRWDDGSRSDVSAGSDQNTAAGIGNCAIAQKCPCPRSTPYVHLLHSRSALESVLYPALSHQFTFGRLSRIGATVESSHSNVGTYSVIIRNYWLLHAIELDKKMLQFNHSVKWEKDNFL